MGRLRLSIFPNVGEIFEQRVYRSDVFLGRFDQGVRSFDLLFVQLLEQLERLSHLIGDDSYDSVFKVLGGSSIRICIVAENPRFVLHLLQNFTIAKGRPGRVAVFEREGRR